MSLDTGEGFKGVSPVLLGLLKKKKKSKPKLTADALKEYQNTQKVRNDRLFNQTQTMREFSSNFFFIGQTNLPTLSLMVDLRVRRK